MRVPFDTLTRALTVLVTALLALPALGATAQAGSYAIGTSTVTFTDRWELRTDYSGPESVFLTHVSLEPVAFVYTDTADAVTSSAELALDELAGVIVDEMDPGTAHVVGSGMVGGTTAFRLYDATVTGIPVASLVAADVTTKPGRALLTLLTAPSGSFDMVLEELQAGIQLDGQPLPVAQLDPAAMADLLESDPVAAQGTIVAGQAPAVIDGVDYRQLDAPSGCDRIGWAITDPAQLPASEPDLDQRGACAGGASYVARCGTVPGERADTRYITCSLTALVTDGPQEFAYDMFELVEADGDSEYIDFGMSFGKDDMFPSGEVPQDATVSGTASFALDATATEPLLLEIRPPSLPAGADPAVIVIEGPLQPLAVFD